MPYPLSLRALARLAVASSLLATGLGAQAALRTWYLGGHMLADNGGSPLDARLETAFASGGSVQGSFSFSTNAAKLELIPGARTDFVTSTAQGGATALQTTHGSYATPSSRVITQYSFNGESLALNANALPTGPGVAGLDLVALDLLVLNHVSAPGAADADKWPWYTPGSRVSQLPDLSLLPADALPTLVFTFHDPVSGDNLARIGRIDSLSLTAPVPEPGGFALAAAGLGWLALALRRRPR